MESLEPLIHQIMSSFQVPGLAVGIAQEDQVIFAKGFGVRSIETREPVTATSLFHQASISKLFVATALVQLAERGQVDLEAPVVQYLPYFQMDDDRYQAITIQQMLSHTGGMPDVEDYSWDQPEYDEGATERYVRSLRGEKLIANPGEKFAYSNMAFEILGDLIAKVAGTSFEDYVKTNILDPLGMAASTFLKTEVPVEFATTPHIRTPTLAVSDIYPYHRAHAPSSTLHSNALEMCYWGLANLNRGTLHGRPILKPSSHDLLWRPRAKTGPGDDSRQEEIGLSWFLSTYRDVRSVMHAGSDVGFESKLVLLPEKSIVVAVMANVCPASIETITHAALDVVLGHEPQLPKPPLILPLGRTLAEQGLDAAIAHYHRDKDLLLADYDLNPNYLHNLGFFLMELNRFPAVIDLMRLSIEVFPDPWWMYRMLGQAYRAIGEKDLAIRNVRKSLELNPKSEYTAKVLEELEA